MFFITLTLKNTYENRKENVYINIVNIVYVDGFTTATVHLDSGRMIHVKENSGEVMKLIYDSQIS